VLSDVTDANVEALPNDAPTQVVTVGVAVGRERGVHLQRSGLREGAGGGEGDNYMLNAGWAPAAGASKFWTAV